MFWNRLRLVKTRIPNEISVKRLNLLFRYWFFSGLEFRLILICFEWSISEIFVMKIEKVVIGKCSEEEILWFLFIFSLEFLCHYTNWKDLLEKYRLKIKGLLKFGNLSWKFWTLIVFTISVVLPPRKNTQNGFGVSNCYQKN